MADAFSKLEDLPPLRLTVRDIADVANELASQADSGGRVVTTIKATFQDDTWFTRDSSDAFLANVSDEGERVTSVQVQIHGWSPSPDNPNAYGEEIVKSVLLELRDFGSQLYVGSNDPLWGKGAIQTIKRRLDRYKPWYSGLLRSVPYLSGVLDWLPLAFIILAIAHERKIDWLVGIVIVLSVLLFVGNFWIFRKFTKRELFANTIILRRPREQRWAWWKLLLGVIGFAADIAALVAVFLR